MGENITNFLNSFNTGLDDGISKQDAKKTEFKAVRDNAITIKDFRTGIWPNDTSVKTIGELFGYVFPASGGVKNEPFQTYGHISPMIMTPEYEGYLQDVRSSDDVKKTYTDLKKSYSGFVYSLSILKEKGGAQFWFDYFMYYAIEFRLKNTTLIKKLSKVNGQIEWLYFGLLTGDGSKTIHYSNLDVFSKIILENSSYNEYSGLEKYLTQNLTTDDLLFNAFVEAGESYSGPYTNEIKTSGKTLFKVLDVREEPKPPSTGPIGPTGSTVATGPTGSTVANEPIGATGSTGATSSAIKFVPTIKGIIDGFQITAKTDLPNFTIYVGDPEKWPVRENIEEEVAAGNVDDFMDLDDLDDEYSENEFKGAEEVGISVEEYKNQALITQEPATTGETEPGEPVKIEPVGSFDNLLRLADKCARSLGKNKRVKYENLRQGYISGVHGLCPQGTACVLYAMSGVKNIQPLVASANYLSFGKQTGNSTTKGEASFPKEYYNDKVKIGKDYWKNKSGWQVGDVVVVAYVNKADGHIQVWTGYKWMSDFTQGALQSYSVDWNTPALWRLNSHGIQIVKKQMGTIS